MKHNFIYSKTLGTFKLIKARTFTCCCVMASIVKYAQLYSQGRLTTHLAFIRITVGVQMLFRCFSRTSRMLLITSFLSALSSTAVRNYVSKQLNAAMHKSSASNVLLSEARAMF